MDFETSSSEEASQQKLGVHQKGRPGTEDRGWLGGHHLTSQTPVKKKLKVEKL